MSFIYKETIPTQFLRFIPDSVNLSITNYIEAKLLRLLLGTCNIKSDVPSIEFQQRRNYCNALNINHSSVTSRTLKTLLHPITLDELDSYLQKVGNTNYALINDIISEFSFFFLNQNNGNHTSAFIHLYRILEYISYSFPLVHASTSKNYQGTFKSLQSYFTTDGGELNFLSNFVKKLFDDEPLYQTTVDFNVVDTDSTIQNKLYKSFKKVLPSESVFFDDSRFLFTIEYSKLISVIINIRNRYFHFAIGGPRNIRTSEIEYPDLFFKQINDQCLNWLVIIYFEVTKTLIDRWK